MKELLKSRNWKYKDLAAASNQSETTISRMINNTNGRGGPFKLTDDLVYAIALGLGLGVDGWHQLSAIAFPQRALWQDALACGSTVVALNCDLYARGLPTLGTIDDDTT